MDVTSASKNVMNNLVGANLVSGEKPKTATDSKNSIKGQEESQIQKGNSLLSGVDLDTKEGKEAVMKRASKIDAKLLTQEYAMQFMMGATSNSQNNLSAQSALSSGDTNAVRALLNSIDAESIGYKGKPLGSLTAEEAKALVSGDGYFSKDKTAERIADFVIMGAGDNLNKLQRGREGIERGLKEATKVWGGDLPDISQETVKLALEKVDKRIEELQKAQSALNVEA